MYSHSDPYSILISMATSKQENLHIGRWRSTVAEETHRLICTTRFLNGPEASRASLELYFHA